MVQFILALALCVGPPDAVLDAKRLQQAGRIDDAVELLTEYLEDHPRNADALLTLANVLLAAKKAKKAVPVLRRLARLRPGDGAVSELLIQAWTDAGRPAQAALIVEGLLVQAPTDLTRMERLIGLYLAADEPYEAADVMERRLHVNPNAPELWRQLAELREGLGHPRDALDAWQSVLVTSPNDVAVYKRVAELHIIIDHEDEAIAAYQSALGLAPKDRWVMQRLADLYGWNDKPTRRHQMLVRLLQDAPNDSRARWALVRTHLAEGQDKLAMPHLEHLVAQDPTDLEARVRLVELYEVDDEYDKAIPHLEVIAKWRPENLTAKRTLAGAYRDRGDTDRALELYRDLAAYNPGDVRLARDLADLELAAVPKLSIRYDFMQSNYSGGAKQTRHSATARFEHRATEMVRWRVGYRFAYTFGATLDAVAAGGISSHDLFTGVLLRLKPKTFLDISTGLGLHPENIGEAPIWTLAAELRHEFKGFPLSMTLRLDRRAQTATLDAILSRTVVYGANLALFSEPVERLLLDGSAGYGHFRHTDLTRSDRVGNDAAFWTAGIGVRATDDPLFEIMVDYTGEYFDRYDQDGIQTFPYFAPPLYQTLGLSLFFEHLAHWRVRYALRARPSA